MNTEPTTRKKLLTMTWEGDAALVEIEQDNMPVVLRPGDTFNWRRPHTPDISFRISVIQDVERVPPLDTTLAFAQQKFPNMTRDDLLAIHRVLAKAERDSR